MASGISDSIRLHRLQRHVQAMELAEAAYPSDHEPAIQPEPLSHLVTPPVRGEHLGIYPVGCHQQTLFGHP